MSDATTQPPVDPHAGASDLAPGVFIGEYRVERLLGRGGMGTVYAAQQPEIGANVAIKVLAAPLSSDPRLVKRFVDEARVVNKIGHPNIIDVFAFGRLPDGRQYFVMEYLDGETLASLLERGMPPVSEARRLLQQICEALEAAHREQVVHRDLKPENLWIATPKHGQPYAKVLDFGVAKLVESADSVVVTEAGTVVGTPHYMSPEQCRGDAVDHRTDIYAMGVILYKMWSGRLPFEGRSFVAVATQQITSTPLPPSAHRPVPARMEKLILSCLEKDPAARPASATLLGRQIGEALADELPGETVASTPTADDARSEAVRQAAPRRWAPLVVIALLMVLGAGGAWLALGAQRAQRAQRAASHETARPADPPSPSPPQPVLRDPTPATPSPPPAAAPPPPVVARARAKAAPARPRAHAVPDASVEPRPSPLEERGYLKENPFR